MSEKLGTLDLEGLLAEEIPGATFAGKGETPGVVKLNTPDGEVEFDLNSFLKEDGIDPSQVDIDYNSQDSAVEDSPMSFMERYKYENGTSKADKRKILEEKYQKENVQFDPEKKRFLVKTDGVWHNADATGLADVAKDVDVIGGGMVGGIVGAKAGAAIGTAIFPGAGTVAGAAIGGIVGGGLGAVVGRLGTMAEAKMKGLRTEEEAGEVSSELWDEFLLGAAGEAGGVALRAAGKAPKVMGKAYKQIGEMIINPENRARTAKWIARGAGGEATDHAVALLNPEDMARHGSRYEKWTLSGDTIKANPLQQEQMEIFTSAAEKMKSNMQDDYGKFLNSLSKEAKDVRIPKAPIRDNVIKQGQEMGLVDEAGKWIPPAMRKFPEAATPKNVNNFKRAFDILTKSIDGTADDLTLDQAMRLKSYAGEIIEHSGGWKRAGVEIGEVAERRIKNIRSFIDDSITQGLAKHDTNFAARYRQMNQDYAPGAKWIEDMGKGLRDNRIGETLKSFTSPDGSVARNQAEAVFRKYGIDGQRVIKEIQNREVAMRLVDVRNASNRGLIMGGLKSAAIGGTQALQRQGRRMAGTTPLSPNTLRQLQAKAQTLDFVRKLPKPQKRAFFNSAPAISAVTQLLTRTPEVEQQLTDMFVGKALEQSQPQPTPLLPPEEK